jgi:hypothetical protein
MIIYAELHALGGIFLDLIQGSRMEAASQWMA